MSYRNINILEGWKTSDNHGNINGKVNVLYKLGIFGDFVQVEIMRDLSSNRLVVRSRVSRGPPTLQHPPNQSRSGLPPLLSASEGPPGAPMNA